MILFSATRPLPSSQGSHDSLLFRSCVVTTKFLNVRRTEVIKAQNLCLLFGPLRWSSKEYRQVQIICFSAILPMTSAASFLRTNTCTLIKAALSARSGRIQAILRIQFKLNTALLSYCPFVCPSVTGVTSHISHIYKGINAMLIIKPYIF